MKSPSDEEAEYDEKLDEFLEEAGSELDPIGMFSRAVQKCGGSLVKRKDEWFEFKGPICPNLKLIETPNYQQLVCDVCSVSVLVRIEIVEPENSTEEIQAPDDEDNIGEFLRIVGTEVQEINGA